MGKYLLKGLILIAICGLVYGSSKSVAADLSLELTAQKISPKHGKQLKAGQEAHVTIGFKNNTDRPILIPLHGGYGKGGKKTDKQFSSSLKLEGEPIDSEKPTDWDKQVGSDDDSTYKAADISYRFRDNHGLSRFGGLVSRLPNTIVVSPGETANVSIDIKLPNDSGIYTLVLTIDNEDLADLERSHNFTSSGTLTYLDETIEFPKLNVLGAD